MNPGMRAAAAGPAPRCARRRRAPPCFIDAPAPLGGAYAAPSLQDMVVPPGSVVAGRAGSLTLCAARSLPELERGVCAAQMPLSAARDGDRGGGGGGGGNAYIKSETMALRDKFGLFLSVCSLLVSVQYFIPRTL